MNKVDRREFLKQTAALAAGFGLANATPVPVLADDVPPVRLGVIGVGNRGMSLLSDLLGLKAVEVRAVCDINSQKVSQAQARVEKSGQKRPEGYAKGEEDFRRLMTRDDIDAVIIPP